MSLYEIVENIITWQSIVTVTIYDLRLRSFSEKNNLGHQYWSFVKKSVFPYTSCTKNLQHSLGFSYIWKPKSH